MLLLWIGVTVVKDCCSNIPELGPSMFGLALLIPRDSWQEQRLQGGSDALHLLP